MMKRQSSSSFASYESSRAQRLEKTLADPVIWEESLSFRHSNYRQLHHQRGKIGTFHVRLLQGESLTRSYWSALALGPVKFLNLSKAHGSVSAFCECSLEFAYEDEAEEVGFDDRKKAPKKKNSQIFTSPVVKDDNPVWDNCAFDLVLKKGIHDGQRIFLQVYVHEDATPVENFLPQNRMIGYGKLDLTNLTLGESPDGVKTPGVFDAWIDLTLPNDEKPALNDEELKKSLASLHFKETPELVLDESKSTGRIRVLVSYEPHGLEPQKNDIVALEAFARAPKSSSCRPVIAPYMPLAILERKGSYLLAQYTLPPDHTKLACVRIHRNAVFVIERKNLLDAAQNIALLPFDVVSNTPVGRSVTQALSPVVSVGREMLSPAFLSMKIAWVAARSTGLGLISGIGSLVSTFLHESTHGLQNPENLRETATPERRKTVTAQFVSL
jgi:hypothetical protein